jgi:ribonuclease-3
LGDNDLQNIIEHPRIIVRYSKVSNMLHKRRSDGGEPPRKRHYSENGSAKRDNDVHYSSPKSLPELPHITSQYDPQVFTHMSALGPVDSGSDSQSYERLEFLGDAYIELFASRLIWKKFPTLPAGKMSQLRESLVKNGALGELTCMYGFDARFRGTQDLRHHPTKWAKVKADMFEAYVAAVVLSDPDKGAETAEKWLVELWTPRLGLAPEKRVPDMLSKVQLSGKIGGKGVVISYVEEKPTAFEKGDQVYFIGAYLTGWGWDNQHLGSGKGTSKGHAGNDAAANALMRTALIDEIVAVKKAALLARDAKIAKEEAREIKEEAMEVKEESKVVKEEATG